MSVNYADFLERGLTMVSHYNGEKTKLEYLSDDIFNFTTYDSEIAELFAKKAIDVCDAITNKTTFEYIKDSKNYEWFLIMCNLPFFSESIDWGTSIRGAWWCECVYESCGLWDGDSQVTDALVFSADEWTAFVRAIVDFSRDSVQV